MDIEYLKFALSDLITAQRYIADAKVSLKCAGASLGFMHRFDINAKATTRMIEACMESIDIPCDAEEARQK